MFQKSDMAAAEEYIAQLDEPRRGEILELDRLIREAAPQLQPFFLSGMLAYGPYHYRYASGREGNCALVSLSSRKAYISLYVMAADERGYLAEQFRGQLPKADIGKSCVRFKRLSDVDLAAIKELITRAAELIPRPSPDRSPT